MAYRKDFRLIGRLKWFLKQFENGREMVVGDTTFNAPYFRTQIKNLDSSSQFLPGPYQIMYEQGLTEKMNELYPLLWKK